MRSYILTVAALASGLALSAAAQAETQVTTYVVKVQEERQSTRWTLTEWLRIKERMKMMDVWLAMFSDPKKDKFQPELMLNYDMTRGNFQYNSNGSQASSGSISGTAGKAQLWLTNLISSTVGIRTLNVDFGAEMYRRQSGNYAQQPSAAGGSATASAISAPELAARNLDMTYYTGDLRIFGRNIQDSSLVLKYGQYVSHNTIIDTSSLGDEPSTKGVAGGVELQLYLFRNFGLEGNYMQYGDTAHINGSPAQMGHYYDYEGFIEVSLLRIMAGVYAEDWSITRQGQNMQTQERGSLAGLKVQF